MKEAYTFFGFGDGFIKMLLTLSFEWSSCITMDDNSYSRSFNIETGTLQGDSPSPILFNICEQILLFRIEFDTNIKSIFFGFDIPRTVFRCMTRMRLLRPIVKVTNLTLTRMTQLLAPLLSSVHFCLSKTS